MTGPAMCASSRTSSSAPWRSWRIPSSRSGTCRWRSRSATASSGRGDAAAPLGTALDQFERNLILRVLERVKWNQSKAAAVLGLHRNTLLRKIAKWGLSPPNPD